MADFLAETGPSSRIMSGMGSEARTYKFTAKIEAGDGGGAFVFFPFDAQKAFGTRSKIPVQTTFDSVPYRGSLIPYGHPQHMLGVLKALRKQISKDVGDTVEVELWKDEAPRNLEIPQHFLALLEEQGLLPFFESLSFTHRKEYVRWITDAKTDGTRSRRLAKAVEMLRQRVKTPG